MSKEPKAKKEKKKKACFPKISNWSFLEGEKGKKAKFLLKNANSKLKQTKR